ncbi:MAG: invertase Pin-like site-specific recombinase [Frankiales bacterium]|nr:invertase Pin-like site-specific recombinase [Frankiales bacterium]
MVLFGGAWRQGSAFIGGGDVQLAREMYDSQRYTVEAIALNLGVSRPTIYKHLNQERETVGKVPP